jgi:hypothetical protein
MKQRTKMGTLREKSGAVNSAGAGSSGPSTSSSGTIGKGKRGILNSASIQSSPASSTSNLFSSAPLPQTQVAFNLSASGGAESMDGSQGGLEGGVPLWLREFLVGNGLQDYLVLFQNVRLSFFTPLP